MLIVMLFITGCEEESTAPDPFLNGLMIKLAKNEGYKNYEATDNVSFTKSDNNVILFTAEEKGEIWKIQFLWSNTAQIGDTVFISDNTSNYISLSSTNVGNHEINSWDTPESNKTYILLKEYVEGEILVAEIEGFINSTSEVDTLKNGYLTTTRYEN